VELLHDLNNPLTVVADPHVQSEGRMLPIHVEGHDLQCPNVPFESSAYTVKSRWDPPEQPGRDSEAILQEAGFTAAEIAELIASGAVMDRVKAPA
jgi:crotonobetainyl-CoA:carnitine CoA-transferase CaiB-like acyl-CoA transferase